MPPLIDRHQNEMLIAAAGSALAVYSHLFEAPGEPQRWQKNRAGYVRDFAANLPAMLAGGLQALGLDPAAGQAIALTARESGAPLDPDKQHAAGGYYCQNCSKVLVTKRGALCAECRRRLAPAG